MTAWALALCAALARDPRPGVLERLSRRAPWWPWRRRVAPHDGRR